MAMATTLWLCLCGYCLIWTYPNKYGYYTGILFLILALIIDIHKACFIVASPEFIPLTKQIFGDFLHELWR